MMVLLPLSRLWAAAGNINIVSNGSQIFECSQSVSKYQISDNFLLEAQGEFLRKYKFNIVNVDVVASW